MAGVSDAVHRALCIRYGAGLAPTEMVASDISLWRTEKSHSRFIKTATSTPHCVQIVGYDADMLAAAARAQELAGADIIDINMGCPAKKVCAKAAGSALMRDETLVAEILQKVVAAVSIPVTLKTRTGWSPDQRNGLSIARIAEDSGIQALTIHGRTRACRFKGQAEYDTIAEIKAAINIPLIANGDIDSAEKAKYVLKYTGADAIMVGRASQGNPFIFQEIAAALNGEAPAARPSWNELTVTALEHLQGIHQLYGAQRGYRIARKHIGWYFNHPQHQTFIKYFHTLDDAKAQHRALCQYAEHTTIIKESAA